MADRWRSWRAHELRANAWWALVVLPATVLLVRTLADDRIASGDIAAIELRVRDVFGPGVWLGPYSRFGWSHPGPLLFWIFAGPYELMREHSGALLVAALAINVGSVLGIARLLRRHTTAPNITLIPLGLFVLALGPHHWTSPWNPDLPVLPFAFVLTAVWARTLGDGTPIWLVALSASFVVQSHIGFVLPVVGIVIAGGVVAWRARRRHVLAPFVARDRWLTVVVLAICWFGPIAEQANRGSSGNVAELWRYLTRPERSTAGFSTAFRLLAYELGPAGSWLRGLDPPNLFSGEAGEIRSWSVPLLALVVIGLVWRARSVWAVASGATILVGVTATGLLAIASIEGGVYPYLVRWVGVVGWWAVTLAVIAVPRWPKAASLVASGAWVVIASVGMWQVATAPTEYDPIERKLPELLAAVRSSIPEGSTIRVAGDGRVDSLVASTALILDLERSGETVGGRRSDDLIVGGERVIEDHEVTVDLVVGVAPTTTGLTPPKNSTEIARIDELTPAQRSECERRAAAADRALARGDTETYGRLFASRECGRIVVVWEVELG